MSKLQQAIDGVKAFVTDVRVELKKCSWPTRSELVDSTVVVIVSVLIVSVFVGMSDVLLWGVLRMIIR
ncbi:MAG TPA: preprotein translocase subunit SecE [Kiritimatiellia bacterium]|nr:preprotein translocase subunit SecE [Kiritimatiellia bacterium]